MALVQAARQPTLKGRALRLLSQREHSRAELERKLRRYEEEEAPGALQQALDELQARGFISEQRVAASLVHRRGARLGTVRLRQELEGKGLARELVEQTLAELQGSELERAREVWRKKFGTPPDSPAARAKQMRFLLARGFAAEVVRRVLAAAGAPEPDETL